MPMSTPKIKFCGLTRAADVAEAVRLGVDFLGFNFHPDSPRYVGNLSPDALIAATPAGPLKVGIFVNRPPDDVRRIADAWSLDMVQLHAAETPGNLPDYRLPVILAVRVRGVASLAALDHSHPAYFLLDAYHERLAGGTGRTIDWDLGAQAVRRSPVPVILAGGLTPGNVAEAVRQVQPFAVDVAGGIEQSPGVKSAEKMRRFVAAVRGA